MNEKSCAPTCKVEDWASIDWNKACAYLLQMCSNNLNQYAKRANECGKIYSADLADLRTRLDELIDIGKQILSKLAEL